MVDRHGNWSLLKYNVSRVITADSAGLQSLQKTGVEAERRERLNAVETAVKRGKRTRMKGHYKSCLNAVGLAYKCEGARSQNYARECAPMSRSLYATGLEARLQSESRS